MTNTIVSIPSRTFHVAQSGDSVCHFGYRDTFDDARGFKCQD